MQIGENKRPSLGGLHHVAIDVTNLQEVLDFYINILGLEELPTPDNIKEKGIRWLELGEKSSLHLVEVRNVKPSEMAHFALKVDDVNGWRKYLEEKDVKVHKPIHEIYNVERFFLKDPSGNRFEIRE